MGTAVNANKAQITVTSSTSVDDLKEFADTALAKGGGELRARNLGDGRYTLYVAADSKPRISNVFPRWSEESRRQKRADAGAAIKAVLGRSLRPDGRLADLRGAAPRDAQSLRAMIQDYRPHEKVTPSYRSAGFFSGAAAQAAGGATGSKRVKVDGQYYQAKGSVQSASLARRAKAGGINTENYGEFIGSQVARAAVGRANLARQPGRLVSRNELLERVWPGLVVDEGNIAAQIAAVRKALADDLIVTVPGHGYRLALHAVPAVTPEPPAAAPLPPPGTLQILGRDEELARLRDALGRPGGVTLVGPGGVGKTALARSVAAGWSTGQVAWLDLTALSAGEQVVPALCRVLAIEPPAGEPWAALARALDGNEPLLVLDNAEHLLDAIAALVPPLVQAARRLRVLVTSQAALGASGERVERLPPLALPPEDASDAQALASAAMALFVERVRDADSRYPLDGPAVPLMRQLCAHLDGLPLALEMAAARVPLLGLQGVCDALGERFAVLRRTRRDGPSRQRTLHSALDWSFGLLAVEEQRVFCSLAVFAGSFSLELAVAVAGDGTASRWDVIDRVAALVDRSLVSVGPEDPPRYRLLETMRDYALEKLAAAGDEQAVRARHARAMRDMLAHATQAQAGAERERLGDEAMKNLDNVRTALHWCTRHDRPMAVALSAHAASLTELTAWRGEVFTWMSDCEALLDDSVPLPLQALWWRLFARQLHFLRSPRSMEAARRAVALARATNDPLMLCWALHALVRAQPPGPPADAQSSVDEMLALAAANPHWPAELRVLLESAMAAMCVARGDFEAALKYRLAELALARRAGLTARAAIAETNCGWTLNRLGRHAEALTRFRAFLSASTREDFSTTYARVQVVRTLAMMGRLDEALAEAPAALSGARRHDWLEMPGIAAWLAAKVGHWHSAALLFGLARSGYGMRGLAEPSQPEFEYRQLADALSSHFDAATLSALLARGAALDEAGADRLLFAATDAGV